MKKQSKKVKKTSKRKSNPSSKFQRGKFYILKTYDQEPGTYFLGKLTNISNFLNFEGFDCSKARRSLFCGMNKRKIIFPKEIIILRGPYKSEVEAKENI